MTKKAAYSLILWWRNHYSKSKNASTQVQLQYACVIWVLSRECRDCQWILLLTVPFVCSQPFRMSRSDLCVESQVSSQSLCVSEARPIQRDVSTSTSFLNRSSDHHKLFTWSLEIWFTGLHSDYFTHRILSAGTHTSFILVPYDDSKGTWVRANHRRLCFIYEINIPFPPFSFSLT